LKLVACAFLRREGKPNQPGNGIKRKTLQKLFNKVNYYSEHQAYYYHRYNGKIEAEICFFDAYITRQPPDPMQPIV
jgi:hypothetical protein